MVTRFTISLARNSLYPTTHGGVLLCSPHCYTKTMQKIATKVFIYSSIVFGIIGILIVITAGGPNTPDTPMNELLIKLLFTTVFIILPSFALSVASKYLSDKS